MHKKFTLLSREYLLILVFFIYLENLQAQVPTLVFEPVISSGLSSPVDIVNAGDGSNRIFIVQQGGTIKVYDQSLSYLGDFLTVTGLNTSGTERGLLSLAFHPQYGVNGYLYVYYTAGTNGDVTIARYSRSATNPNQADPGSRVILLTIPKPIGSDGVAFNNHNGGKLNFGPEGYLYFGPGDGGSGDDPYQNAQDGSTLRGKMIRLDVNNENPPYYIIPSDNPYTNDPNVRDEIWALGLRNPWRWSFDKLTHDMWIGDVGQNTREEVDFRLAGNTGGINYGWRCYEGFIPNPDVPSCSPSSYVPPIFDYTHDFATGGISVIGGYVYRGSEYASLQGYYICGDYVSRNIWLIKSNGSGGWNISRQHSFPSNLYTFGEAENGSLYAAGNNAIYKVATAVEAPVPVNLISFVVKPYSNYNELIWKTGREINLREFVVEFGYDGLSFQEVGQPIPSKSANGNTYIFKHILNNERKIFYRLKMVDQDDHYTYSNIIATASKNAAEPVKVYPSVSGSHTVRVELNAAFRSVRVFNMYGQLVHLENLGNSTGNIYLNVESWQKGMYILVFDNDDTRLSKKLNVQ